MKTRYTILTRTIIICIILFFFPVLGNTSDAAMEPLKPTKFPSMQRIEGAVNEVMATGKIPGAVIVLISGTEHTIIKAVGYADLEKQIRVTGDTLFELGSCSKSFTALAMKQLEQEGMIKLDDPVSKYFPWFRVTFRNREQQITINQLLHHTSGIPERAFGKVLAGNNKDALVDVLRRVSGMELKQLPGRQFEYSNVNYDIAGAILEKVSGLSYEAYMVKKLFLPLGMTSTGVGTGGKFKATGYKIAFGTPRPFDSPLYRGNFPAGYVVTSGNDMVKWLNAQLGQTPLGQTESELNTLIATTHKPDPLLQGFGYKSIQYSMGWFVLPGNISEIFHGGANPNFTAYVALRPAQKMAVAVLTNSNSTGSQFLGARLMQLFDLPANEKLEKYAYDGGMDNTFSMACYVFWGFLVICGGIFIYILIDWFRGLRHIEGLNPSKLFQLFIALCATLPLVLGIYFVPDTLRGLSWQQAIDWAPASFPMAVVLLLCFLAVCNLLFFCSLMLPYKDKTSFRNKYIRPLPMVLFLGFISGLGQSASMVLISTSFFIPFPLQYLLYYFLMTLFISVLGQKIVQTKMTTISNDIVYELRMKLIDRVFATRFQNFEKIDSGRFYATLNNDTETISNSAGIVVGTITSAVTALAAFVYLSAISLLATLSTLLFAVFLGLFYVAVGKKSRVLMEKMRDTQNVFMKLIEGLSKGFRELSMHHNKKVEYAADVEASCLEYRNTRISSIVKFIDANLVSSSMILVLLAGICISFPRLFPDMSLGLLISFIMVLLYMIGPITAIMGSFPAFIRIKVSWDRIKKFSAEIPAIEELLNFKERNALSHKGETVNCLEAKGVMFSYSKPDETEKFTVGPIDLKINKGEILFIVGGNGSGKTTLAKLITGLYLPEAGTVTVDGKVIGGQDYLGEYFSVIFDDYMLFEKLYNIDINAKKAEIEKYLKLLAMDKKVELKDQKFSTINLSSGQRKRLALLQCYLEDCPIYLFDEVAADQDPEFRKFFYRDLLLKMKAMGKIIIAITHDDHYFDVADQIIKLDLGKIDNVVK